MRYVLRLGREAAWIIVVAMALALPWIQSAVLALANGCWSGGYRNGSDRYADWRFADAAGAGDVAAIEAALRDGASVDFRGSAGVTQLMSAAARGDLRTAEALLRAGACVDATDPTGQTALFYAAAFDQDSVARRLLRDGADPGCCDLSGRTPTDRASEFHAARVTALLRERVRVAATRLASANE